MKHSIKITAILLVMFLVTQLIGLAVINKYTSAGDNLPYGMTPPKDIEPSTSLFSILTAIFFAVILMFLLMSFRSEFFLRLWFFLVVALAVAITLNAAMMSSWSNSSLIALLIALPLAFLKIYRRNIIVHNLTELLIYPGIAVIFVSLLNLLTIIILLVLISIYDMYAVWHAGFMQKMARYQIQKLKVFSGFFIPYFGKKDLAMIARARTANKNKKNMKNMKKQSVKMNVAILGGGDVVFPLIFAGVIFRTLGFLPAIAAILGATAALAFLFMLSKKGKFYPAMPFISAGCFAALALIYLSFLIF